MLLLTSLNEDATIAGIKLGGDVLERLAVYFQEMGEDFGRKINIVHRKSVFQILIRIMRLCPVDTGRLRGSFTTFMDAHGNNNYFAFAELPGIGAQDRVSPKKGFDYGQFETGRRLGEFVDAYLNTQIGTNVQYAAYVDASSGFLTKGLIWGDTQYTKNMTAFLLATARAEVAKDPISNEDNGQGGS